MFNYLFNPDNIKPPMTAQTKVLDHGLEVMGQTPDLQPMNL